MCSAKLNGTGWDAWDGSYPSDCFDYWDTCGAENPQIYFSTSKQVLHLVASKYKLKETPGLWDDEEWVSQSPSVKLIFNLGIQAQLKSRSNPRRKSHPAKYACCNLTMKLWAKILMTNLTGHVLKNSSTFFTWIQHDLITLKKHDNQSFLKHDK